ncbi:MAG TPA: organomercurial lyase, partial [Candidatus Limnocylindrales bacterium]|nr:organomercurial lyase [Candidatus Limnocylindrales bacterium]
MIQARPTVSELARALRSAAPTLDEGEQRLALALYRLLLRGRPVSASELAATVDVAEHDAEAALARWPGVFRDRKGRIIGFWGLAVRGMPHKLATSAGEITTWCALDPLIIAPLVTDRAAVESSDPISGEQISLTVTRTGVTDVKPTGTLVSMLSPEGKFDHDVVQNFCHFVHFFASEETGRRWVEDHAGTFLLTMDEAFEMASQSWPALFHDALLRPP